MINVNNLIKRYEEDRVDENKSTSEIIEVEEEDFRKPAEELSFELGQLSADRYWWMGMKTRTEAGILELGPEPPRVSFEEIFDYFDIDREAMLKLINQKKRKQLEEIKERTDVEDLKEAGKENVRSLYVESIEAIGNIRNTDKNDTPFYVAKLLKEMNEEKVSVDRYFKVHFIFDRVLKAEIVKTFRDTIGDVAGLMK